MEPYAKPHIPIQDFFTVWLSQKWNLKPVHEELPDQYWLICLIDPSPKGKQSCNNKHAVFLI